MRKKRPKKLPAQIAKHVGSFEGIRVFQKDRMQSFINTALEVEMESICATPNIKEKISQINVKVKKNLRSYQDSGIVLSS